MSVTSSMYAAASGISAMSKALQVIGNNIANVGTIGFKGSRAEFADLLSQSINTSSGRNQLGRGVRLDSVQTLFNQGAFENTSVVTDVAISGPGFFQLTNDAGGTFYSRAGEFTINKDGYLVNPQGLFVSGYQYDANGNATTTIGKINLSTATAPPNPTGSGATVGTGVQINMNLSALSGMDATTGAFTPKVFSLADPSGTSDFSTPVTLYDSLGVGHTSVVYFNRTSAAGVGGATSSDWQWHATVGGAEIVGGTAGTPSEPASGTLSFDTSGALTAQTTTGSSFSFTGGAAAGQSIGFDFTGATQVGTGASSTNSINQDGYAAGALESIGIDGDGVITGIFSNGVSRNLSRLALGTFASETGLFGTGNNLFVETPASGQAVVGAANTGGKGSVAASTLEQSNVDLSEQFINLITTQRAYQANSKVITTSDTMLETVINMIR